LVNELNSNFFNGKYILDLGCGHGNFLHACSRLGAKKCIGIDFGSKSIEYAKKLSKNIDTLEYAVGNVYNLAFDDNTFDFVIQNGVFHHINDEDKAYKEAHRVLKKGGQMWIYTDGGGIRGDLWDSSREILSDIPFEKIRDTLKAIGFSQSKCYHISDGLNAVYRHTTLEEIKDRLSRIGFGMFKRLEGGKWYDLDGKFLARNFANVIAGDGDIRLLATKI
jgi:ubiquinone/menaquinone biosynthesis C-methylase UbiE